MLFGTLITSHFVDVFIDCPLPTLFPRGYLIAAPSVFRSGVEEAVSVTIFNSIKETTVQIHLVVKGETVARGHGAVLGKFSFM